MKKFWLILMFCLVSAAVWAGKMPRGWSDDIDKALVKAEKEQRYVMILFTGSDWCSWCKRLKADVLDRKAFQKFANQHLVLVYFDFPVNKKIAPAQLLKQQNWQKKFGIKGYPTTVILNSKGVMVGKISGYEKENDFIQRLEKLCIKHSGSERKESK